MWEVIEMQYSVHVVPSNDLIAHLMGPKCICGPVLDEDNSNVKPVWVHNAFDRRELLER